MTLDKIEKQIIVKGNNSVGSVEGNVYNISTGDTCYALKQKLLQVSKEALYDESFKDIIDSLNHYIQVSKRSPRNLRTKLEEANRKNDINEAEELKTLFTMKLFKNNFSESAQDCFTHILATLKSQYDAKVKSLIESGASRVEIDAQVLEVINFMYEQLISTAFEQNTQEIKGMLYYLTGNCHIEWRYEQC